MSLICKHFIPVTCDATPLHSLPARGRLLNSFFLARFLLTCRRGMLHTNASCLHMTDSTEIATPPKSSKSRNSNSLVQIQNKPKSQFEFVLRDTTESEFFDLVIFRDVGFFCENCHNM